MNRKNSIVGSLLGLTAFTSFASMFALSKIIYTSSKITPWDIMFSVGNALFLFNTAAAACFGESILTVRRDFSVPLLLRSLYGAFGNFCNTIQLTMISLSKAQAIVFTYPIWMIINGYLFLGEKVTCYDIVASMTAFGGVLVLVMKSLVGGSSIHEPAPVLGVIVGLAGTLGMSLGDINSRKIGSNVSHYAVPAYLGVSLAIGSAFVMIFFGQTGYPSVDWTTGLMIFGVALSSWVSFLLLTKAFQLEQAARIAALSYIQMFYSTIIDVLFFGTHIHPLDILGFALIICGNFSVLILKLTGTISD